MPQTIGSTILSLRQQRNLTQAELAQLMDVSEDTVRRWEADALAPELSQIPKLAFHLQTNQAVLTGCVPHSVGPAAPVITASASLVFLSLSAAGFLAAVILNWLEMPLSGFIVGALPIAAGILISLRKAFPRWVLFSQVILFSALLPLILSSQDSSSLSALRWFTYGSAFAAIAAIACLAARLILLMDRDALGDQVRIWLKYGLILLVLLLILGLFHFFVLYFLNGTQLLYPDPISFDSWEDFRDYMQIPLSSDGKNTMPLISVEESGGNLVYRFSDPQKGVVEIRDAMQTIPDPAGGQDLCTYLHLNQFVYSFSLSSQGNLPVQVNTVPDHLHAQQVLRAVDIVFILFYLGASAIIAFLLHKKIHKESESKSAA